MSSEYVSSDHSPSLDSSSQPSSKIRVEEEAPIQGRSPTREAVRRLGRDRMALAGAIFLVLVG